MEPIGVGAAAAGTAALAGESFGHTGQAVAAGAVLPPGLDDDISPLAVTKIMAYASEVAGMLAASGAMQQLYAVANGTSAVSYTLTDAMNEVGLAAAAAGTLL
jgi:hypothetical protein